MKIRYLEFKDLINQIYTREIKNIEEGIHHEWIEYAGPGYEMVLFDPGSGIDFNSGNHKQEDIWDEDFLKDYRIEGSRMIRRI